MNAQKKTTLVLSVIFLVIFLVMIINISLNFRNYGIKSVEDKALVISELIKHSLTSHMVNGTIDKRNFFLEQIKDSAQIKELWLVRSPSLIKQYGTGLEGEHAKDEIDKIVIAKGEAKKVVSEDIYFNNTFRMTIPYKATNDAKINCLNCHDAKEGDTLGAISIIIDINDIKAIGMQTVMDIAMVAFAVLLLIQLLTGKLLKPYMVIFESIQSVVTKANHGDYSGRVQEIGSKESIEVARLINILMEKFENILDEIEKKIDIFLSHKRVNKSKDPLEDVKSTISQLSDIYKFRRTIEHDITIEDIYNRLVTVFKTKLNIETFTIIECNTTHKSTKVIYNSHRLHCGVLNDGCRADRASVTVDSCQFDGICKSFKQDPKTPSNYICLPYSISNDFDIIVSIVTQTQEEYERIHTIIHFIDDYIDSAKTEFISKKLMQQLKEQSLRDPLTNLYNRKYLEEFINQAMIDHQNHGTRYGVLMADIDYFKMINDKYGHDVGDNALKIIAKVLGDSVTSQDLAARYGGEEFIVILKNCDREKLYEVAQKIRIDFAKQKIKTASGFTFTKTISIGAALLPDDAPNFWKVIKLADVALYDAKNGGRDRVEMFDATKERDENFDVEY